LVTPGVFVSDVFAEITDDEWFWFIFDTDAMGGIPGVI
jgi:hypothetical protein